MKVKSEVENTFYGVEAKTIDELLLKIKNSYAALLENIKEKEYTITSISLDTETDEDEESRMYLRILYSHEVDDDYFVKKQEKYRQEQLDRQRREIKNILHYYPELEKEFICAAPEKI
jgi:hypothetical protein